MKRRHWASLALLAALAFVALLAAVGKASPRAEHAASGGSAGKTGVMGAQKPLPKFIQKKESERIAAADLVARGQATPDANGIVTLKNGKRVRYRLQGTEYLTTALIDFSDVKHGQIPKPDRSIDNSTYWTADESPKHYADMLFAPGGGSYGSPSMHDFYLELSSGRFTWAGQVSNWVTVPDTEADFGANSRKDGAGSDNANGPVYRVVDATLKALAANNYAGIDLAKADQVDRYDCDGDGVYNEPDGYIDHFAIVHAGEGEDAGGGAQGGDAIWSHRWYANFNTKDGPSGCKLGGYQLPGTNLWAGDYTIEAENGGAGVFSHEFGHDLGLPDLYDRVSANDNGTGFWTLMSSGSWGSYPERDHIGTEPVHMGAWEKLALGWLGDDLAVASAGQDATFDLGPAETATQKRYQALRINLPNYTRTNTLYPVDGSDPNYFYSTQGDDIDTTAAKTLPAALGSATPISFRANWDIETDWDYAYLRALVNGTWEEVPTSASTTTNPNGQNFGNGITGASGGWVTVTATLPAGATAYGFRYWTDGATVRPGFAVDSISFQGTTDNATSTSGWTLNGFVQLANGAYTQSYFHYYLVESRSAYLGDRSLCGAYNWIVGNLLEKQCYADGLLIDYRNSGYSDNDVALHPGAGLVLPIDAHPKALIMPDGKTPWRARWQTWDSTFGLASHSVTLSQYVNQSRTLRKTYTAAPVSTFYDDPSTTAYYDGSIPWESVKTAGSGLRLDITGVSADKTAYRVHLH
jgi:immune inhibitor A